MTKGTGVATRKAWSPNEVDSRDHVSLQYIGATRAGCKNVGYPEGGGGEEVRYHVNDAVNFHKKLSGVDLESALAGWSFILPS